MSKKLVFAFATHMPVTNNSEKIVKMSYIHYSV